MIKTLSATSLLMSGILIASPLGGTQDPDINSTVNYNQIVPTNPSIIPNPPEMVRFDISNTYLSYTPTYKPEIKYYNYGGINYIVRNDGFYERDGYLWKKKILDATAYTWKDDPPDPKLGNGTGKTSTGKDAIKTKGFAADPRAIPYGTVIHLENYGTHSVDDTGGGMRKAYRRGKQVIIDVRIPQVLDGKWRSVGDIQKKARDFGRKEDIIVMIRVKKL